jgi:hypothetical protein
VAKTKWGDRYTRKDHAGLKLTFLCLNSDWPHRWNQIIFTIYVVQNLVRVWRNMSKLIKFKLFHSDWIAILCIQNFVDKTNSCQPRIKNILTRMISSNLMCNLCATSKFWRQLHHRVQLWEAWNYDTNPMVSKSTEF